MTELDRIIGEMRALRAKLATLKHRKEVLEYEEDRKRRAAFKIERAARDAMDLELLKLVNEGSTLTAAGKKLNVSPATVSRRVERAFRKNYPRQWNKHPHQGYPSALKDHPIKLS